ncbi:MAG TPA: IS1634 family transposase [Planctomycetaceae bacterium]|nr:IS1634 family transposase [Planctomycetaceae bacterium]
MFIRQCYRWKNGKRHAYWALVESYRTERGPRQRVVAWLGNLDEAGRLGVQRAADPHPAAALSDRQLALFEGEPEGDAEPQWVEVDASAVRVENCRQFGGPWLARELIRRLKLDEFFARVMPQGRERVPWSLSTLVLVMARLLEPSSELHTSEQWYPKTALPELLGVPADRVDDNRLYRALDELLPHKGQLEIHLKNRLGELFDLEYDLLLYDVTSTFFEGQAAGNPLAQRGYSRDQRSDCKQVCIGLVVSRCGMPLGYEVFAGNTADVTTVERIVTTMEARYGKSDRVWVMDRGMVSEANLEFLRGGGRRYIVGTPKSLLKTFERELLKEDWRTIREGIEVKLCARPRDDDETADEQQEGAEAPPPEDAETFILCRSRDRSNKDAAILRRFELRIEERLKSMAARCEKQHRDPMKVEREVGRLLGQNTRAAKLFQVTVESTPQGQARLTWKKAEGVRDWATLSMGCYLLRTNVRDWSDEELWKTYIQLTEAEAAFRIHKADLSIRPIWHQKQDRVLAHILVCFLAYVLWKTLAQLCQAAGLGDEPRRVLSELSDIRLVDVILPTRAGIDIRKRCITRPSEHQQILLDRLGLRLPSRIIQTGT